MTVEISRFPKNEDWIEVKRRALVTVGLSKIKTLPTTEWKRQILISRHSPIRYLEFSFDIKNMPYWLSVELCRHHEGCEKYIKSQRNDRQSNYDRNAARQDSPVNMIFDLNAEALITIMGKRLCTCATKEMRELMKEMRKQVYLVCPEFEGLLNQNCYWNGGNCYEFNCCGANKSFKEVE